MAPGVLVRPASPGRQLIRPFPPHEHRLRKIRCSRSPDAAACDACTRKDIQCIFTERPKTRNRSGKNVEAARLRYGATGSSTPSSGSNSPPMLAAQDSLAQQELAASFGSRLFEEWIDVGRQQTSWPIVDVPVVDFWALRSRFHAA